MNGSVGCFDVDECSSLPCQNGGTCAESSDIRTDIDRMSLCGCRAGWHGEICLSHCDAVGMVPVAGKCVPRLSRFPLDSFVCKCAPGFEGGHCEFDINECASLPCRHGSSCSDSTSANLSLPIDMYQCNCTGLRRKGGGKKTTNARPSAAIGCDPLVAAQRAL